ncbi:hypothetical protein [Clostridium sp. UBA1056]|uniref:hypothetical protein n=1 Tax=Clostridium sp. UBA1056 TaxID=1946346 RepID=UPI0032174EE3
MLRVNKAYGKTEQNMLPLRTPVFLKDAVNNNKVTINSNPGYIKYTVTEDLTSWKYIHWGFIDGLGLKPKTKYTLIFGKGTGAYQVRLMDGSALNPSSDYVTIKDGMGVLTTYDNVVSTNVIYIVPFIGTGTYECSDLMVLEGDWTNKEIPPYFQGIRSVSETKVNLFNKWNRGQVDSNNGQLKPIELSYFSAYSDYIRLQPDKKYVANLNEKYRTFIAFYDLDKKYISRTAANPVPRIAFDTPTNCYYAVITQYDGDTSFNESLMQTVVPEIIKDVNYDKGLTFVTCGKNLINPDTLINGWLNSATGDFENNKSRYITDFIKVNKGTKMSISRSGANKVPAIWLYKYKFNKTYISGYMPLISGEDKKLIDIDCDYIRIGMPYGTITEIKDAQIQLEQGETATKYEAYRGQDNLVPLKEPLRSLPNGTRDILDLNKKIVIKNANKIILNGEQDVVLAATKANTVIFAIDVSPELVYTDIYNIICDKFSTGINIVNVDVDAEGIRIVSNASRVYISILKSKLTTQDVPGFKTWLKNNPTTVYYQLVIPVETPIKVDQYMKQFKDGYFITDRSLISPTVEFDYSTSLASAVSTIKEATESNTTALNIQQGEIKAIISNTTIIKGGKTLQLKDEYNSTVATVDSINKTIGRHTSTIDALSGQITEVETKTNEVKKTLDGTTATVTAHAKSITGLNSTVTAQETSIKQLKESISLKVSKDDVTNTVNGAIDNISVGGRNYYKSTTNISAVNNQTYTRPHNECPNGLYFVGNSSNNGILRFNNVITSNGYWTVSFEFRGSQNTPIKLKVQICDLGTATVTTTSDNTWSKVSVTVNVTNYSSDVYNFVDFENIQWAYFFIRNLKIEKGNKATDWTPAPEDVDASIKTVSDKNAEIAINLDKISSKVTSVEQTTQRKVVAFRYIRDWLNGSTANTSNHWVELKVMAGDTNIAKGLVPTGSVVLSNPAYLTDDDTKADKYVSCASGNWQYVQLDLGSIRSDIDMLKIWHYYSDGRIYKHKLQVSSDGVTWIDLFNSEVSGGYKETANGRTHIINETSIDARIKTAEQKITPDAIISSVNTALGDGKSINTVSTKLDKNGFTIYNGALTIKNKAGATVLYGDTNGDITFTGRLQPNDYQIKLFGDNCRIDGSDSAIRMQYNPITYISVDSAGAFRLFNGNSNGGTRYVSINYGYDGHAMIYNNATMLKLLHGSIPQVQARYTGDDGYCSMAASEFIAASSIKFKTNIQEPNDINFLDILKNSRIKKYNLKTEVETVNKMSTGIDENGNSIEADVKLGFILEELTEEARNVLNPYNSDGINQYSMCSILWKIVQEQQERIEKLEALNAN